MHSEWSTVVYRANIDSEAYLFAWRPLRRISRAFLSSLRRFSQLRFASRSPFPDVHAHPVERNTHNITSVNTRNRYFLSLSLFVSLGWLLGSRTDVGGSSLEKNNRLDLFSRKVSLESFLRFDFTVKHFDWKRRCCESFPNSIRHGMKNDDEREPSLLQISRGRGIHPLVSVRGGCMQFEWTTNERKKWIGDSQSH